MGQEASTTPAQQQSAPVNKPQPMTIQREEEFEGIPPLDPLIIRNGNNEQYPPDIMITPGDLPDADKIAKAYFNLISYHINQANITQNVKKQLEEYIALNRKLETRQGELDNRLGKLLSLFSQLDQEVKNTTDSLSAAVKKANELAQKIDSTIPAFQA